MLTHFLALGDLLIAQIQAELPDEFRVVDHAADLAGVQDSSQIVPACYVVYLGATIGTDIKSDAQHQPASIAWDQDWMTVIVVRSAKGAKQLTGAMSLAGPLAGKILTTLAGWKPTDGTSPLRAMAPGAPPLPSDAGTLYIPLRWRARVKNYAA